MSESKRGRLTVWQVGRFTGAQTRPATLLSAGAVAVLLLSIGASITLGAVSLPAATVWQILLSRLPLVGDLASQGATWSAAQEAVVWQIRLPRVLLAALVGASLALAGATYQGMFRNPLADPYLIGVAAGAGLGAVVAFALPLPAGLYALGVVQWLAFAGALLTVTIVSLLARVGNSTPLTTLLLSGVALGAFASAITSFLMYMNQDKLTTIYFWLLGGLSLGSWQVVGSITPYFLLSLVVVLANARMLNVLQLDEEQAAQLGVNVERLKVVLVGAATLATAAAVSTSGLIGFVGLIVPHAVRLLWGHDYRLVLPLSALVGAIFLLWADTAARTVLAPTELPVGIVTALCGAPFFLYLLRQRKRMVF
ncbi:MAG: FecCD family ABC transporter permease [Chloroflexota bacterium]